MKTNKAIKYLERLISFILNLFWIPAFISPPPHTPVDFIIKGGYVLAGKYDGDTYNYYPAEYEDVKAWRFRGQISLPKIKSGVRAFNPTILLHPSSDHVWEYVDPAGKKHHVTYNTYKQMSESPLSTTLSDKREKLKKQTEKAREQKAKNIANIKGNSL